MKTLRPAIPAPYPALILVLLWVIPTVVRAEGSAEVQTHLLSIQRLFDDLEYERALSQIQRARQVPHGTEEEVILTLYEGVLQCELGQQEQGKAAFKSALLLKPEAKLPVQVAPKVNSLFESVRQQVKQEKAALFAQREAERLKAEAVPPGVQTSAFPAAAVSERASSMGDLRRYSLVPATAGGALAVAGGVAWGVSRGQLNQLRNDDPKLATMEDVQQRISRGRTWQTVGVSLLSVGAAGLAAAAGMYVWGAPDKPVALSVGTDGTSAVIQGMWP
ncbi:hypothetical protein SAMN05444354_1394 [Stigmatella aurantiaca]|uniref:Tetratricopeptide repeat domain protein n=1 Tax=Stigmatella aurantiaca TaxID=41 RepID=A0A1H8FS21_STIAU|nr:hypothetical protein [Stigmatella aurantiaca]SEN34601.1 hypothetical protein SAMN05444354_1394 [Stigmatella aurantiaca]